MEVLECFGVVRLYVRRVMRGLFVMLSPPPCSWDLLQTVEEVLINLGEWRATGEQALSCSEQELIHKNSIPTPRKMS